MKLVISSLIEWILGHFPAPKTSRRGVWTWTCFTTPQSKAGFTVCPYCMSDTRLVWLSQAARQCHLMKICGLTEDEPKACFVFFCFFSC